MRRIMMKAQAGGYLGRRMAMLIAWPARKAVMREWDRVLPLLGRNEGIAGVYDTGRV
ncbi:hypothetical protein WBP06_20670 [Novosphingobium sp. BL-8H]|uniref:hypothetical protein n=1 Tax=Novosphingobium sp. BL-8H TaxID=3127640 RepID=UPI0037577D4C